MSAVPLLIILKFQLIPSPSKNLVSRLGSMAQYQSSCSHFHIPNSHSGSEKRSWNRKFDGDVLFTYPKSATAVSKSWKISGRVMASVFATAPSAGKSTMPGLRGENICSI